MYGGTSINQGFQQRQDVRRLVECRLSQGRKWQLWSERPANTQLSSMCTTRDYFHGEIGPREHAAVEPAIGIESAAA
jgi:hypothetical protein